MEKGKWRVVNEEKEQGIREEEWRMENGKREKKNKKWKTKNRQWRMKIGE